MLRKYQIYLSGVPTQSEALPCRLFLRLRTIHQVPTLIPIQEMNLVNCLKEVVKETPFIGQQFQFSVSDQLRKKLQHLSFS